MGTCRSGLRSTPRFLALSAGGSVGITLTISSVVVSGQALGRPSTYSSFGSWATGGVAYGPAVQVVTLSGVTACCVTSCGSGSSFIRRGFVTTSSRRPRFCKREAGTAATAGDYGPVDGTGSVLPARPVAAVGVASSDVVGLSSSCAAVVGLLPPGPFRITPGRLCGSGEGGRTGGAVSFLIPAIPVGHLRETAVEGWTPVGRLCSVCRLFNSLGYSRSGSP